MPPVMLRFFGIISKTFLLAILILSSCSNLSEKHSSSPKIEVAKEDRVWLEKFFQDFYLDGPAIYTLFGSKPMSAISVCTASKEEWIEGHSLQCKHLPEMEQKAYLAKLEKYVERYDLPVNWEKWIKWKESYSTGGFLFAKRSTEYDTLFSLFILNTQEAAWILQKHYSTFKTELGMDFDPLQVVLEFENPNSAFWEKVFSSHLLQGILHGFGKRNAYFFDRRMKLEDLNQVDLRAHPLFASKPISRDRDGGSIRDIPLPMFRSYSSETQEDPEQVRYKEERAIFQKKLKGKNLVDAILFQLGYQNTTPQNEIVFFD